MQFKSAAAISVTYTLLERCGFELAGWFDKDDFRAIHEFSTPDSVYALGAAVSDMSREVLRNIERTVKTTIRRRNPAWHGSFSGSVSGRIQPGTADSPAAHSASQDHHPAGTKRHWQCGRPPHETDPVHLQQCWPYPQFALQAVMSMIPVNRKFLRGDIYYANLEPHLGSEQGGIRPVVVVQNNTANCYSPNLIVAPVTSNTAKKPDHQAHVLVDGNRAFLQPSMILAESVQTISKGRLIRPMGRLSIPELIRLNYALLYQLDLNEWVWRKEAYERYLRYHR